MKKAILFLSFFLSFFKLSFSQNGYLFYRDQFKGGVSCDGYSPNAGLGGTGNININIAANSTIKKAFLFAGRQGIAQNVNILFDGNNLLFDSSNQITNDFFSAFGGNSALHMIEVTQYISSSQSNYQLIVPQQSNNTSNRYTDFYLYVAYENNSLNEVCTNIYLNEIGFNNDIRTYNINPINKINNSFDVGISLFTGYLCDTIEGENVFVNNNYLGLIGLPDINNGSCGGTKGSFYYENNVLFALQDDTANTKMKGSDAISEVSSYVINNDTSINVRFDTEFNNNNTNAIWAIFTTYTSSCSFTTTITTNDTICLGDSIQLNATGGLNYSWHNPFSTFNDSTLANPIATPTKTTTYICTITNDSGCVKTEQVKIWVNPLPVADTLIVTDNICGDTVGSIAVGNIPNGTPPFNYQITNLQTTNTKTQTTNLFDSLVAGNYEVLITDNNGCRWKDTLLVSDINVNCDTNEISLIIPNVFTPNFDGNNDNFVIQLTGTALIKSLKAEVFNRWGMLIKDFKLEISNSISNLQSPIYNLTIWDGYTTAAALAPEGTYFYVINYETLDGEAKSKKGSVTLLR